MGDHIGQKRDSKKRHRPGFNENRDFKIERARRVTFKNYVQSLEDELLEDELLEDELLEQELLEQELLEDGPDDLKQES